MSPTRCGRIRSARRWTRCSTSRSACRRSWRRCRALRPPPPPPGRAPSDCRCTPGQRSCPQRRRPSMRSHSWRAGCTSAPQPPVLSGLPMPRRPPFHTARRHRGTIRCTRSPRHRADTSRFPASTQGAGHRDRHSAVFLPVQCGTRRPSAAA